MNGSGLSDVLETAYGPDTISHMMSSKAVSRAIRGHFLVDSARTEEGVGCTEASFSILETIHDMLERGSKVFGCFLEVRKAFDTVWIDGLLYKLFSAFGIRGRMWIAFKDLYTGVRAQVLYSGSLSKTFDISQGTCSFHVQSLHQWFVEDFDTALVCTFCQ